MSTPTDPREGVAVTCYDDLLAQYQQLNSTNYNLAAENAELKRSGRCVCKFDEPPPQYTVEGFKIEPTGDQMIWTNRCAFHAAQVEKETDTLRAELEAVNTRYSELAAKRAKTDQLYQLALNNQEDLGKRLEAARKERDEWKKANFENCIHRDKVIDERDTALAAKDAAEKERDAALEVLRQIATLDCGCVPCTGQCRTGRAAEIELESRMELARAALAPAPTQEPPAGGVTTDDELSPIGQRKLTAHEGRDKPDDVPSEGRGELLPFNLSDALAGKPVVTRDASWNGTVTPDPGRFKDYPATALINGSLYFIRADGRLLQFEDTPLDLFMLPTEGSGA